MSDLKARLDHWEHAAKREPLLAAVQAVELEREITELRENFKRNLRLGTKELRAERDELRERVEALTKARDNALTDRLAYEQIAHDSDARLNALIENVGWEKAGPIIKRVDKELGNAR